MQSDVYKFWRRHSMFVFSDLKRMSAPHLTIGLIHFQRFNTKTEVHPSLKKMNFFSKTSFYYFQSDSKPTMCSLFYCIFPTNPFHFRLFTVHQTTIRMPPAIITSNATNCKWKCSSKSWTISFFCKNQIIHFQLLFPILVRIEFEENYLCISMQYQFLFSRCFGSYEKT